MLRKIPMRGMRGFTLVELLVVIGIIALLVSILLPALQRAKAQSLRVKCGAHLHNVGASLMIYANDHKGKLPQHVGGSNWLWDIPFPTRDALLKSGNQRETLYCPASSTQGASQNADELWNFSGGYCVSGYFWLMKRPTGALGPLNPPKKYLESISHKNASELEVAADAVISRGGSFVDVKGGWAGIHSSTHVKRNKAEGGNILFLDGHVQWKALSEMKIRYSAGSIDHWF